MESLELNTPKKGKGKIVTIIVLLILLLGVTSYFIYDKDLNNKEIEKLKTQIEKLDKKTETENKKETKNSNAEEKNIAGYYKSGVLSLTYQEVKVDDSGCRLEGTQELVLKEDGTFQYSYSKGCDGATRLGKYTYTDKQIILVCNSESAQCLEGTEINIKINSDGTLMDTDSNVYYKIDKSLLQLIK